MTAQSGQLMSSASALNGRRLLDSDYTALERIGLGDVLVAIGPSTLSRRYPALDPFVMREESL